MNTGARLALYGAGLLVAFGGAFSLSGVTVPDTLVNSWEQEAEADDHDIDHSADITTGDTTSADSTETKLENSTDLAGLSLSKHGYALSPIEAPSNAGQDGELSFHIEDPNGRPVTSFTTEHDKELHLIVARTDGSQFRHVHPTLDRETGTWSLPWKWAAAGTYRVFADFTPTDGDAPSLTLTRTVQVAGNFTPVAPQPSDVANVAGFTVSLSGHLVPGSTSALNVSISRDGKPVKTLEPYLGSFGHMVALREGDLAYLHVHPEGPSPTAGETSGPDIGFAAEAPTPGRYLLYLDFQVDGQVHTAEFVLDAHEGGTS